VSSQEAAATDKYTRMLTAPVEKLILRMAAPAIAIVLISSLHVMADTYFVGQLSTRALAGVAVSFSLVAVLQALGFFFGQGSGTYISRRMGAGDMEAVSRMTATGVVYAFIAGIFITIAGLLNLERFARLLGSTDTILPYAENYLRFILVGAPMITVALLLYNILRFQGNPAYGAIGLAAGALLSTGLTPLFIFVFDMGVSGAGLSVIAGQVVSLTILIIGCHRTGNAINLRAFSPRLYLFKEMALGGLPSLCRQGLAGASAIILNHIAGAYEYEAIAAVAVVARITMLITAVVIGVGHGLQPVAGFNYGAGQYDRVTRGFWFCIKIGTIFLTLAAVVVFPFAEQVVSVFQNNERVIEIGTTILRMMCLSYPGMAFFFIAGMLLQTIGKAGQSTILAVSRQGIFLMAFILILPRFLGLFGLQLGIPLADISAFLFSIPITMSVLKEIKNAGLAAKD